MNNPMLAMSNNQSMAQPYAQNYFGNQSIATPGFIANNFPSSSNAIANEPANRRKSIIDNINPFMSEQKVLPTDLLSAFPVSSGFDRRNSFGFHFLQQTLKWFAGSESTLLQKINGVANCKWLLVLGGSAACSFIETVGWRSYGTAQRNRRIGTGIRAFVTSTVWKCDQWPSFDALRSERIEIVAWTQLWTLGNLSFAYQLSAWHWKIATDTQIDRSRFNPTNIPTSEISHWKAGLYPILVWIRHIFLLFVEKNDIFSGIKMKLEQMSTKFKINEINFQS